MSAHLIIKLVQSGGRELPMDINLSATIMELKEQISIQAGIPKESIRLVCGGKIWQDVAILGSYEPRDSAIVHCLNNPARVAPAAADQVLSQVNPMQAMMGAGATPAPAAAAGGDPFAQMMAQSQQMMSQNPEMMQQLMDSPMIQQMMSDPETLRSMMRMNPRMEQLMEQRPELAQMLEDPEVMRQSMQMMRNPSLMREAQRNADLSIGRLDAMPGGHNALVRAHEDMVDPMMAALSGSGENGVGAADLTAYAQQTDGGPNSEALPNPWGAPAASPQPLAAAPAQPQVHALPTAAAQPGSDAMAAMMQQMMGNPAMMQQPTHAAQQAAMPPQQIVQPDAATAGMNTNPMAAMMQQMMSNPAMMQQSMQMAQQMGMGGYGAQQPLVPTPASTPSDLNANPYATMMQQMMNNQQQAGAGFPGMFSNPAFAAAPLEPAQARVQFAAQLEQLSAMGFNNEAACLRVLQQNHGRVDAAIDTLLASGEDTA